MPSSLNDFLTGWLSAEPMASSVMLVAAFLLFVTGLARILDGNAAPSARTWRLVALLAKILAFVVLAWAAYFLLRSSNDSFSSLLSQLIAGGEQARKQQAALITNWGGGLNQSELLVQHYVEKEYIEEYPQEDNKPTLYLRRQAAELLEQESIIGFEGVVDLHLVDPALATYECDAMYRYHVVNASDLPTRAEYSFPLPSMRFYENVSVRLDGKPAAWTVEGGSLRWQANMSPRQESRVEISLKTRGAGDFGYGVPSQRVIQDFSLTISTDTANIYSFVSPDSSAIHFDSLTPKNPDGYLLRWTIDHAILLPRIGVQYVQPEKSSLSTVVTGVVGYAARGLVLMISLIALTLIICGANVSPGRLALVGGLVCAQFLALMAVYPVWGNYLWPAFLFLPLTLVLSFLLLRQLSRLPLMLTMVLIALFAAVYPFTGLVPGERERNAIDGALQVGMILYIFGLTLYTRVRRTG